MKKEYELGLGYFKEGDNLAWELEQADKKGLQDFEKDEAALIAHADTLERFVKILRQVASLAKEGKLSIKNADTYCISVSVEEEIGEQLVKDGVLYIYDDEDDEDEEYYFDEEDEDDEDEVE